MHTVSEGELTAGGGSAGGTRDVFMEGLGTAVVVLCGCGTSVMASAQPQLGSGVLGGAVAFGAAVATMGYVAGSRSCNFFNPVVTVGLLCSGRIGIRSALARIVAQVAGALLGTLLLLQILSGRAGYLLPIQGLAANGYAEHSPGGYGLGAAVWCECALSFVLAFITLSLTERRDSRTLVPAVLGVAVTLVYLFSAPITNGAANPARSTGPALVAGGWALQQLWLFWVAPLVGAVLAGGVYRVLGLGQQSLAPVESAAPAVNLERRRRAG